MRLVVVFLFVFGFAVGCSSPEDPNNFNFTVTVDTGSDDPIDDAGVEDMGDDEPDEGLVLSDLPTAAPCATDSNCAGGTCLTGDLFPDGYCTTNSCGESCANPSESCVNAPIGNFCAPVCAGDNDCRDGYTCGSTSPRSPAVCVPIFAQPDGTLCDDSDQCQSGRCRRGLCMNFGCQTEANCNSFDGVTSECVIFQQGFGACFRTCDTPQDCIEGDVCEPFSFDQSFCTEDTSRPIDKTVIDNSVFDFTCFEPGGRVDHGFTVADDTTAYQITPINIDGSTLTPQGINLESGASIVFNGPNQFQAVPSLIYGGMNPTIVPATSDFISQLEPGDHTYVVDSNADELCFYQLEETEPGDTLDINFYFVGVPGLDSTNAETHVDFQLALTKIAEIYTPIGLNLGVLRYFDITGDNAAKYSVPNSDGEIAELVALSTPPGPTADDALSINVFFVQTFNIGGGAIGISEGLPGPAGLHGTHGSGVAFTSEFLGQTTNDPITNLPVDGNDTTAQVMAHEIGHYLGLFHTSESSGQSHDPLQDTPQCNNIGANCPDINNLMFPFAGDGHIEITPNQSFVIGVHPLTKTGGAQ